MIYSISNRWKYISILITIIILIHVLNTRQTITDIDMNLLNNFCYSNNNEHKEPILIESKQVNHIKSKEGDIIIEDNIWNGLSVKGAFYMIVQNSDLHEVRATIRSLEDRFNSKLNVTYPWILLNNQPFTNKFKKYTRMVVRDHSKIFFGQIDLNAWSLPYWIDSNRMNNAMKQMAYYQVEKADSQYFHHLQRYQTGLFIHHSLFDTVEYIWQLELGTTYTCDLFQNDPFIKMKESKKKIGFTMASKESQAGMFSLWPASVQFMKLYNDYILPKDKTIMSGLVNFNRDFNFCQMWDSFQIMETSFLRSTEYQVFFQYLDYVGGFFYERWTAASVRTIAAAMFLKVKELHFFQNVGYQENRGEHCPFDDKLLQSSCTCQYQKSYDLKPDSCSVNIARLTNPKSINSMLDFAKSKIKATQKI